MMIHSHGIDPCTCVFVHVGVVCFTKMLRGVAGFKARGRSLDETRPVAAKRY